MVVIVCSAVRNTFTALVDCIVSSQLKTDNRECLTCHLVVQFFAEIMITVLQNMSLRSHVYDLCNTYVYPYCCIIEEIQYSMLLP